MHLAGYLSVLTLMTQSTPALAKISGTAATSETSPHSLEPENINTTHSDDSRAQFTPVSQLMDVQPTDWAFSALRSLVARYGVIAGYPKGIYRGNRAITRYEFAAGLQSVLERVNELRAARLEDLVSRDDLVTLQRLQSEFAAELYQVGLNAHN